MMTSDNIVDVNETDFEYEVISYSENIPVVVEFWATWCKPCKTLGPMLETLAREAQGTFRLARVDVDANPNLALHYNVRSIPTVKAFSQGEVVGEFTGLQPEERVREFLARITPPSPLSLAVEKGNSMLQEHDWQEAESIFGDVLDQAPQHPEALLGMAIAVLGQGYGNEALEILHAFPASREYTRAQRLLPLAEALEKSENGLLPDETDLDAAFGNSVRLAGRGNLLAALDGLLDILRQDKHYRHDAARQVFLGLLELLGDSDPQSRTYRSELAAILF
ncbi:thioredoxin [Longilinea arvoryzae]|uniref:Thioredoxin n=1 Tax=Longilinea arvoryzae TaxID=360412 RepID=A0A0S7B9B3_9CHLR|nr:tetratricopeptide repeat protein [Longilinea arvoryzae]GAP14063.1 thioredoxin [Longilinea arvoryzae]